MVGRKEVSLWAQDEVLENISVKAGMVLELVDLDKLEILGVRDSAGLLFLFPDKFLILVQKWKSCEGSPDKNLSFSLSTIIIFLSPTVDH